MYVGDFSFTMLAGISVLPGGDLPRVPLVLACLSFDSSLEPVRIMRGDPGKARVLIFTTTPLSLELEVMAGHVAGQIVPPGPGEILVETPDGGSIRIEADDIGFFAFAGLPRGRIRLRCDTPTGRLITDWICL
jgi:hypothetical protein